MERKDVSYILTLKDIKRGASARVIKVGGEGELRRHFLDMGVIPGAEVKVIKYAPMGDPVELMLHGYELTLRLYDAEKIEVEPIDTEESQNVCETRKKHNIHHPGLGEGGKYHIHTGEKPIEKTEKIRFALAGNQNSGKTTLFNRMPGANQHVGNFPGVTVDRKSGQIKNKPNTEITDLPGIYSMSPYSSEEMVTRRFILEERPDCIINIVDATNIERNLYLTMQLMELDIPVVLALNMMDEVRGNGGAIYINELEALHGIPVVPISAAKNEGIDELIGHAMHVARYSEYPTDIDFCDKSANGGAVHRCLHGIMNLVSDHPDRADIPILLAASKLVEGDLHILEALNLSDNEKDMLEHIIVQMEKERGLDRAAAIADMRFSFITRVCETTVIKPKESRERERSRKIDKLLTGKYTAIPMFVIIMAAVFFLTFNVIGAWLQGLLETGIEALTVNLANLFEAWSVNETITSLVIDGILAGVGSVLSFLPIIIVLFFFLSLLEDSGYMARVAFVMDKLLRRIGLSGRSIVPMLIGFGCTVPAVMATRTLPSERDRKMTILLTPFMSCTAKLPIYAFFANAFFPNYGGLVMIALYFIGIAVGIIVAFVLRKSLFKGDAVPFVMELPNYRMPGVKNVMMLLWDKAKDFLQRAFTIIFIASVVIWFLQMFDFRLNVVTDPGESILSAIAGLVAPVFEPLGFGDWRICTALVAGFMAKESVVSTLSVLSGGVIGLLTPASAWSLLVFCLLYTPCVAAVSSVKRELGGHWATAVVIGQCVIAWVCAYVTYLISGIIL